MRDIRLSRLLAFSCLCLGVAAQSPAEAPPRSIPLLMTESGHNYVDVEILKFAPEGPIFRHRDGMANLPYGQIKEKTRKLLGYPMPQPKQEPKAPAAAPAAPQQAALTLIPVRITTHWTLYQPEPAPFPALPCHRPLHPWYHHQAAWPFEDPFRPFAAVDFMVVGGVVPHPGWPGPNWIW